MENSARDIRVQTEAKVLVVDLDGTLIRSDMLFETFWDAVARDWTQSIRAVSALSKGIPQLKRELYRCSQVDVTTLPYNPAVLEYIKAWREENRGPTALVTASDTHLATAIADHLGLFDEAHGSNGDVNLKGEEKSKFLTERYGADGYAYMGDSSADLPVWESASLAVTVGASSSTREQAEALNVEVEHLSRDTSNSLKPYLKGLRPHQWLKNLLIFIPFIAAHDTAFSGLQSSLLAFAAFCVIASSVYLFNDLLDLSADRRHLRKRFRPLASGDLPIAHGTALAFALLFTGLVMSALLSAQFLAVIALYFVITTTYSVFLKRQVVIDIIALSALYTIRVIAGGVATGTEISIWLLAFSGFFFLSLAAVKRQAEISDNLSRGKKLIAGRGYNTEDLPMISQLSIASGYVSVLVMVLYVQSPDVAALYQQPLALLGTCVVLLYWITRVSMITHRGDMHDDPIVFAAKDPVSYGCLVVIAAFALFATTG